MFQYAAGMALSLQKCTSFYFDDSLYCSDNWYSRNKVKRSFGLHVFCLTAKPLSGLSRFFVLSLMRKRWSLLRKILSAFRIPGSLVYVNDMNHERMVDERLQRLGKDIFLDGYWQTEDYFKSIRNIILDEFKFHEPPNSVNSAFLSDIASCDAICVHVRRTDYLTCENLAIRGICGPNYYQNAIEYIKSRFPKAQFYFFSDDPTWVKEEFSGMDSVTIIGHNVGHNDSEDLRLMISCKHFIIANSSFSWWAAWLGQYPGKIVIAPKLWMANGDDFNIVPNNWIRL